MKKKQTKNVETTAKKIDLNFKNHWQKRLKHKMTVISDVFSCQFWSQELVELVNKSDNQTNAY